MAGNKAAIKSRIKSINSTKKITGAMELISNVKLTKNRSLMLKNRAYAGALEDMVANMLSGEMISENNYLTTKDAKEKLYFVFTSDMGLCGGYNINIEKLIKETVSKDDYIIFIGNKSYASIKKLGYNIINEMTSSDTANYMLIKEYADKALEMYRLNKINSINVIYTCFVNNINFKATVFSVLPGEKKDDEKREYKQIEFEPSADEILKDLIPMMVESQIYSKYLESKTSEHGNRRFAMENATDNANELTDNLLLAYNQARQAAITQEITEIVSGADAL